jgi:hypothetical protein
METNASAPLPRAELAQSRQQRQLSVIWSWLAAGVREESGRLCQQSRALHARYQQWRQRYYLVECAWCKKHLRWQYMADPLPVPMTSHGVCPTCHATVLRDLSLMAS